MTASPEINCRVLDGSPPPLVLLHGWRQTLQALLPLGTLLNTQLGRAVHVLDLPGFGNSGDVPREGWTTLQYAERIIAYLDAQHIASATIIGHSFGGRIAIRLASRFPERVHALVLIDSAGLPPLRNFKQRVRLFKAKATSILAKYCRGSLQHKIREYRDKHFASEDYQQAGAMRTTLVKAVQEDLTSEAAAIRQPALLLWGELDRAVPVQQARQLAALIANSSLVVLPEKDHFPYLPLPDKCAYYIVKFLQALAPPRVEVPAER